MGFTRGTRIAGMLAALPCLLLAGCAPAAGAGASWGPPEPRGVVRIADAIIGSRDSRTLTVTASVESIARRAGCDRLIGVPSIEMTATTVTVGVDIAQVAAPKGIACTDQLESGLGVMVRLPAAIGHRALVDGSDGETRPVLVLSDTPSLHSVPAGFTERTPSWSSATGWSHRWWRNAHDQQIELDEGPVAHLGSEAHDIAGARAQPVRIGRVDATLWRERQNDTVESVVVWRPTPSRAIVLQVVDQARIPLSTAEVVALTRTVG